ncbi:MAG: 4-hydroxy-tetrahydrodipicolinate reductase, partial [Deltaproteobacteria bacterium]|nr:4-hydroxy-tetrahydrodipicolinate reductase [Deltaproteobacteria bacterium]
MVDIIVAGAAGRMGMRIINIIHETEDVRLTGASEHPDSPVIGQDAGQTAGVGIKGVKISSSLETITGPGDVIIDFTLPQATMANVKRAASSGKAIVIGTTGLSENEIKEIKRSSEKVPIVLAPNMSVGVNVMFKIAAQMAKILGSDYDMEIVEAHHRLKKDAPSGTAIGLAKVLSEATGRDLSRSAVYSRHGITGERRDDEIGIQAVRAGDIAGDHTVLFGGIGERLELTHRAHNRDNFARGAVRAAKWIKNKKSGLYDMQD